MDRPPYEITGSILKLYGKINDRLGQCKGLMLIRPEARLRRENRIRTIHREEWSSSIMEWGTRLA